MKCERCNSKNEENCKFCPQCGEKIIVKEGETDLIDTFTKVSQVWFSLGAKYGIFYERKNLKAIEKMEEPFRKDPEFCEFYEKSINFAKKNILTKLNEDKKEKVSQNRKAH